MEKKKYRLAKGADGKERPWQVNELYQLYMRGWRDGAGLKPMREDHMDCPEYNEAYAEGGRARQRVSNKAVKRLGYKPGILRLAKGKKR